MKSLNKILIISLLLFNGIGGIYGGWQLMMNPDGSSLGLSAELLKYSPFENYLVPGITLFICNGLLSFFTLIFFLARHRLASWLLIVQGVVLIGWIAVQLLFIHNIHVFHIILIIVGMLLVITGWNRKANAVPGNVAL